ncbi:MAG: ABC transporter substrate-binding protein [Solobacterium sp.]|nr:ABC transporter substrate-binding protein [Solobacterium sp.]
MKKVVVMLITVLMMLSLVACGKKSEEEPVVADDGNETVETGYKLVSDGVLTVSMSTDFAPMEFVDLTKTGQEKYVGSDVELAKFIADYLGLELLIKPMDFDTCQASVANGIVDCSISGYSYTAQRAASYLLSEDYFSEGDSGQVALIAKENVEVYKDLASLNQAGVEVAAQNGALQQEIVEEQLPNATLKAIDDLNAAYDNLIAGTYAAVVVANSVAETLVASYPEKYAIVPEAFDDSKYTGYHVLIALGNDELKDAINEAIAAVPEDQYKTWQDEGQALFLSLGENAAEDIIAEEE